jgi:putative Mg2+ transporter-C (MgtC) family protein
MSLDSYFTTETFDWILRLSGSILAGAVIGVNRDMHGKPTGVRLHGLVSLSSALLVMAAQITGDGDTISRVVQGIVGGIGFLGAGVIMHGGTLTEKDSRSASGNMLKVLAPHRHTEIYHLTTAASIWATAAFGVTCGLGLWKLTFIALIGTILVLTLGNVVDRLFFGVLGISRDAGDPLE